MPPGKPVGMADVFEASTWSCKSGPKPASGPEYCRHHRDDAEFADRVGETQNRAGDDPGRQRGTATDRSCPGAGAQRLPPLRGRGSMASKAFWTGWTTKGQRERSPIPPPDLRKVKGRRSQIPAIPGEGTGPLGPMATNR